MSRNNHYLHAPKAQWHPCAACGEKQKVALSALGKRRMKNVDKDIDKNNKQMIGVFSCNTIDQCPSSRHYGAF
jgi:Zn ribbon nucleic-acid-binding protein